MDLERQWIECPRSVVSEMEIAKGRGKKWEKNHAEVLWQCGLFDLEDSEEQ